jgi:hypothetical protein
MSRDAANRARRGLVAAGWLIPVSAPNRRKAITYQLSVPDASSTGDAPLSGTRPVLLSSTSPDASSTGDAPEQYVSRTQPQFSPQNSIQRARDAAIQPPLMQTVDGCADDTTPEDPHARAVMATAARVEQHRRTA